MTSNARIFFAGVGTTFVILAVGFGGGLMLAKSALHDQPPQMRASSEPTSGMRVILPPSAEPAIQVAERTAALEPKPQVQPVKEVQAPVEQKVEKEDPKRAERDLKAERRRYAERKAKRMAAARARQQVEPRERTEPGIMAFGGDESRMSFGNQNPR
jgi:type IV secretory pathway VirB10-like protein